MSSSQSFIALSFISRILDAWQFSTSIFLMPVIFGRPAMRFELNYSDNQASKDLMVWEWVPRSDFW